MPLRETTTGLAQQARFGAQGGRARRRAVSPAPAAAGPTFGQALTGPTDPRWVLAVRTAELLEGPILRPERREGLLRLGGALGLSLFDANLVLAIVQDQARRGYAPTHCPAAGEMQLRMVPLPSAARFRAAFRARRALYIACGVAALIAAEILLLTWAVG